MTADCQLEVVKVKRLGFAKRENNVCLQFQAKINRRRQQKKTVEFVYQFGGWFQVRSHQTPVSK